MITQEQIDRLRGDKFFCFVLAILTRDYKPKWLDYVLLEGTVIEVTLRSGRTGSLFIGGQYADNEFPYDAAELLE